MRRGRFAGVCGHLIEAGALVLELLLKAVDLALQTQYMLLLNSQSLI
jgi:hypothetical protein